MSHHILGTAACRERSCGLRSELERHLVGRWCSSRACPSARPAGLTDAELQSRTTGKSCRRGLRLSRHRHDADDELIVSSTIHRWARTSTAILVDRLQVEAREADGDDSSCCGPWVAWCANGSSGVLIVLLVCGLCGDITSAAQSMVRGGWPHGPCGATCSQRGVPHGRVMVGRWLGGACDIGRRW